MVVKQTNCNTIWLLLKPDLYTLSYYNNMQEVYVVKNYEDKLNVYVMGVFSSRRKAEAFIEKVEEIRDETIFEVRVVEYTVVEEDVGSWIKGILYL